MKKLFFRLFGKRNLLVFGGLASTIFVLNILFIQAAPVVGDLPPPGSVQIGEPGGNSTAYRLGDTVYQIVHNGDTVTRDQLLYLHNSLGEKMTPGLSLVNLNLWVEFIS